MASLDSLTSVGYSIGSFLDEPLYRGSARESEPKSVYYLIGDIGGSSVDFDIWDLDEKEFLEHSPRKESMEDVEVAEDVMDIFSSYAEEKGISFEDQIYTVSLGCTGIIDDEKPKMELGSNISELDFTPWEHIIRLENDVTTAALAEYLSADKEYGNVAHMNFGTGTNCGVITNHAVSPDREVGFTPINFNEDREISSLGRRGVLEAYTSGSSIPDHYREWCKERDLSINSENLDAGELLERYNKDEQVQEFVEEDLSLAIAAGLSTAVNDLNPDLLTVGGSVILENDSEPDLLELAKKRMDEEKWDVLEPEEEIRRTPLGKKITFLGALANTSREKESNEDLRSIHLEPFGDHF